MKHKEIKMSTNSTLPPTEHQAAGTFLQGIIKIFEDPDNFKKKIRGNQELFSRKYKVRATVRWFIFFKKGRRIRIDLTTED